jgi:uncharacterized membrane protein YfcA
VAGALPAAVVGALVATAVPTRWVNALLVLITLLSLLRALGWLRLEAPDFAIAPAGVVVGALTGGSGGAAVMTAPLLLSAGLTGEAFVGTSAVCAVALHVGRMAGYGLGGLFTTERVEQAALLALFVVCGNALGRRARTLTDRLPAGVLEHVVLLVSVGLALAGIRR